MSKDNRTVSISHIKYSDPWRILALSIIKVAAEDCAGVGIARHPRREDVMQDARDFFFDGRYRHYAEMAGIDPTVIPPGVE